MTPTQDDDGLTLTEINSVLYDLHEQLGGFHIDLFGCDACMMATYEMAAMLSYYDIDWFVASEELEPGTGWHYTPWLQALDRNPDMTLEQLCALITDSYMEACLNENPDEYLTFSAIDLSKMAPLREAMEQLGTALQSELEGGQAAEIRAVAAACTPSAPLWTAAGTWWTWARCWTPTRTWIPTVPPGRGPRWRTPC